MSEEREKLLKRTKSDVRSVLLSAPRGVLKRNFRREFMSLVGQDIPLNILGLRSIDEFARTFPDVMRESIGPTGEPTFYVVANAETQHVASLVSRQKKPSLKALKKATPLKKPVATHYQKQYRSRPAPRPAPSKYKKLVGGSFYHNSPAQRGFNQPNQRGFYQLNPRGFNQPTASVQSTNPQLSQAMFMGSNVPTGGNLAPWKQEYKNAVVFNSVTELISTKERYQSKLVCVTGFPGHQDRIQQYNQQFRILLFNDYEPNNYHKQLQTPVLNVFFGGNHWPIKEYNGPLSLPPRGGVKLTIWGQLDYKFWEKLGDNCHSLRAVYYRQSPIAIGYHNRLVDKEIKITVQGNSSFPTQSTSTSSSPDLAVEKHVAVTTSLKAWVQNELKDKPNGLWGRVLQSQYKKDFQKEPPSDLLKIICGFPFIKKEEHCEGNPILYYSMEENQTPPIPKHVELDVTEEWLDVVVVNVVSSKDFCVQRLSSQYSKALEKLTEVMGQYYHDNGTTDSASSLSVKKDVVYAVCWTESSEWCRAIVINGPDSKSNVHVKYPDYGNEDSIPVSQLHTLPNQFYSLPFQAIRCSLTDFANDSSDKASELFDKLVFEKPCSMLVNKRSHDRYMVDLIPPEEDVSVIDLIDRVLNPIQSLVPRLPSEGNGRVLVRLVEVCAAEPGYVFLHIIGPGTDKLELLLNDINEHYKSKDHQSARDRLTKSRLEVGMVCCAQFDGEWHRAMVTEIPTTSSKVTVKYIDYGTEEEYEPSRLRKTRTDNPLNSLPPQAIKCKLHGLPTHKTNVSNIIEWLSEYVDEELHLEMVTDTECVLFDKTKDTNINQLLLLRVTESTDNSHSSDNSDGIHVSPVGATSNRQYNIVRDLSLLQYQALPQDNNIFTVCITHCESHMKFNLHLESQAEKMIKLQHDLQEYCRGNPPPLTPYQEGMVGVGRYRGDNMWYRVLLRNTFQLVSREGRMVQEVPVCFVDYGNEDYVTDIVAIDKKLLEQLPFQGIPAQLSGNTPTCSKDAFSKRLLNNKFYCHVKGYDEATGYFQVSLMDCSTCKLINDIL